MNKKNDYIASNINDKLLHIETDFPRIMSTTESLEYIIQNKCSVARFGDGELSLCLGEDLPFQKASKIMTEKLIEVLKYASDKSILIAFPEYNSKTNNIENYYEKLNFWQVYWLENYDRIKHLLIHDFYGNANISRNSVFFENKLFEIKKLWANREVVFVRGKGGRFEVKEELFDNIKSKKTIFTLAQNAFDKYDEILKCCLKESKEKIFLLSCGPTATILAFDLMKNGYQALDIGHLPNCYDEYLGKIESPEKLPYEKISSIKKLSFLGKKVIKKFFFPTKVIYLTFDDGPSSYSKSILKILKDNNIPSIFFLIGKNIISELTAKELMEQMLRDGHTIGLHTMNHQQIQLYYEKNSPQYFVKEMLEEKKLVSNILNGYSTNLCRAPHGTLYNFNKEHWKNVRQANLECLDWNIDSYDWMLQTSEEIIDRIKKEFKNQKFPNRIVLLLHELEESVKALPEVIEFFQGKGYIFVPYISGKKIRFKRRLPIKVLLEVKFPLFLKVIFRIKGKLKILLRRVK